ncbi:MAG: hypothetical protein QW693_04930 [Candidatus Bathyarchaeia archaeon]
MNLSKIENLQFYMKKIALKENLKYRIVIVKNAYFLFLDEHSIKNFHSNKHEYAKGWYTGVLSFTLFDPNLLYIFISEVLYKNIDVKNLFLRILHQIFIYLNPDIPKLKIKKLKKILKNYLVSIFQNENPFTEEDINVFLNDKRDAQLFNEAEILIPHLSFYNLIKNINFKNDELIYLENVKSYLKPHEYIQLCKHHDTHEHNHEHEMMF